MITCPKCGATNDLGKVFCAKCGTKLPAQGLQIQDLQHLESIAKTRRLVFRIVGFALTVWIVGSVLLAAFPHMTPLVVDGIDLRSARLCSFKLSEAARMMQAGKPYEASLTSEEITSYIRQGILAKVENRSGSVLVRDGGLDTRWIVRWNIFGLNMYVSADLSLVENGAGGLSVSGAKLGHLPLAGFGKNTVSGLMLRMCGMRREWPIISRMRVAGCANNVIRLSSSDTSVPSENLIRERLPLSVADAADATNNATAGAK